MGRKLGRKLDRLLTAVIVVILLPLFITIVLQRMKLEDVIYGEQEFVTDTEPRGEAGIPWGTADGSGESGGETDGSGESGGETDGPGGSGEEADGSGESGGETDGSGGSGGETDGSKGSGKAADTVPPDRTAAEQKIVSILAREIRADANQEVILAQSVIVRTNLYDAWERQTAEPEGLTEEEMKEFFGESYAGIKKELERCVSLTGDEVLVYEGDYIYAPYHAMSAGMTRDITTLYEQADMPYLTAVSCVGDATAEGCLAVECVDTEEFIEECREQFDEAEINNISELEVLSRDEAGYVIGMRVGTVTCTGEEFRNRLGLRSACYTLTELDGQVRVVTKGLGHGLGLSQHAAGCMAEEGADYRQILTYFYPGAEITKVSDVK